MNEQELLQKADTTINQLLGTGGMMLPELADRFRVKIMDEPTIIPTVRRVPMSRNEMRLPAITSAGRMLRAARNSYSSVDDTVGVDEGFGTPNRALAKTERSNIITDLVTLSTKEVIAQINLTYEMLEDVVEGGQIDNTDFEDVVLSIMAQQIALDLEEKLILGDTASGDAFLAQHNGIVKITASNVHNHSSAAVNAVAFGSMLNLLPTRYQRLLPRMRFLVHHTLERAYRLQVAARQTQLGDAMTTGSAPVSVLGVPLIPAAYMPTTTVLLTDPRNILVGIQRDFRLETVRDPENRLIKIIVTMRVAQNIEEETMMVKGINIAAS